MSKTSIYKKPDYSLSFGVDDVVYLDLEIKITRTGIERQSFELEIVRAQLSEKNMEFARWLVGLLGTSALETFNSSIKNLLVAELTPSLYSLFYVGELQEDDKTT